MQTQGFLVTSCIGPRGSLPGPQFPICEMQAFSRAQMPMCSLQKAARRHEALAPGAGGPITGGQGLGSEADPLYPDS